MATPLVRGWQATVSGLVNLPQLNGATVRLVENLGERWRVAYEVDGERLTYNVRPANLTGVNPEAEARQILRDKGLPQSEAYVQWQIRTMAGLRGAQNPRPAMEQVAHSRRKKGGATVTGLTEKDVVTERDDLGRPTPIGLVLVLGLKARR